MSKIFIFFFFFKKEKEKKKTNEEPSIPIWFTDVYLFSGHSADNKVEPVVTLIRLNLNFQDKAKESNSNTDNDGISTQLILFSNKICAPTKYNMCLCVYMCV